MFQARSALLEAIRHPTSGPTPLNSDPALVEGSTVEALRQALVRSDARYEALMERAGYGVYRSSADGRFVDVNQALAAMLDYRAPSELLGLDLAREVYLDPGERDRLRQLSSGPEFPDWVETRWKRRDGTPIQVRLSVRPIIGSSGGVEYYDGLVEDLTERHRHDELLRRNERMATLGTTLAGVAHELNNPLAAIIGFAQLLLKNQWTADDRAALEAINHEAMRSATIVRDLLALTRRRDSAQRVPINVNDIITYITRTRRYALETMGIGCRLELDPGLPLVSGDRTQLEQVVLNLVNNAEQALRPRVDAEHGPVVAHVTIRTRRVDREVVLEVEDNGPGIPEDSRTHIWDPFWTTKDEGAGTGLGLTVVHGIVADHCGTISLESTAGSGARFVVRLPVMADRAPGETTPQAPQPLDVLIVDPEASDLAFVERFLSSRGHAVITAATGDLALRLAGQTTFDAVICSTRLVGRDGVSIATALRSIPGCAKARFVLAADMPDLDETPQAIDGTVLVAKPYDVEELRRLIEGD
jgi:PAS domain S-box-containing protein